MESRFQFSNPVLTSIEFQENKFRAKKEQSVQIRMNLEIDKKRKENANEAIVSLKITIGAQDDTTPFYIEAVESAKFKWSEELDEERVQKLLNQNAPSLLLAYLRPMIMQVTAASRYEAYNIPFINFAE